MDGATQADLDWQKSEGIVSAHWEFVFADKETEIISYEWRLVSDLALVDAQESSRPEQVKLGLNSTQLNSVRQRLNLSDTSELETSIDVNVSEASVLEMMDICWTKYVCNGRFLLLPTRAADNICCSRMQFAKFVQHRTQRRCDSRSRATLLR
jgi:hypothetical protein